MIKGSIQEDIKFINIYAPNTIAYKHVKQILTGIKGDTGNNTIIVGHFNTPLTSVDRLSRQEINKATWFLNDTSDQLNLIDTYRTLHPKTAEYTFFSSAHGMFSKIDHMLGHRTSHNKFKMTEITSSISFQLQQYETRNQLQEEKWEKHKHVETEQHANKTPVGQ